MVRDILIDGYKAEEIIYLEDLEELTIGESPVVFFVGTARVLAQFTLNGTVLHTTLAVVENGGEGILPVLIETIESAARLRGITAIEWNALSRNCSSPNPKLNRVLERLGFIVRVTETNSEYYWHRKSINDSLLNR